MNAKDEQHRAILQRIAQRAMLDKGLLPDFSVEALSELARIQGPATMDGAQVRDRRDLLWASIDNDDSRDLDQLTVAEAMPNDKVKIFVAVADVDSIVKNGTAFFDKALLFDGGSISRTDLYVNEVLATKCGVRRR